MTGGQIGAAVNVIEVIEGIAPGWEIVRMRMSVSTVSIPVAEHFLLVGSANEE